MTKHEIKEAQEMFNEGQTFYAISIQMGEWYGKKFTTPEKVRKALGGIEDNPLGHPKFKGRGHPQ